MSKIGNQKYSNYEYAPGIATYGIDGKAGSDGKNGTSVFVSVYNITNVQGIQEFGNALLQNFNMTDRSEKRITRQYIDGDCFIFQDGSIWRIDNIKDLKNAVAISQFNDREAIDAYMSKVGQIESTTDDGFTESGDFLVLDTANYKGFVIDTTGTADSAIYNDDYISPFTVLSNNEENDNKTYFISLKSIFAGEAIKNFNIYYDNDNSAWVIDSDTPILFNCDVKFSAEKQSEDYDNFSKPLIVEDNITSFYSHCKRITYKVGNINPVRVSTGESQNVLLKKLSNYSVEYTPVIEIDSKGEFIKDSELDHTLIKIFMMIDGKKCIDKDQFKDHYFDLVVNYGGTPLTKPVTLYYKTPTIYAADNNEGYGKNNVSGMYEGFFYACDISDGKNDFMYINLDATKIMNNYTVDDNMSITITWKRQVLGQWVEVPLNITFKVNDLYHKTVDFILEGDDEDLKAISESMLHISSYVNKVNGLSYKADMLEEYYLPLNTGKILEDKKFTLETNSSVTEETKWNISVINGVEVKLKQS